MWKFSLLLCLLIVSFAALTAAQSQRSRNSTSLWKTLNGNKPLVVARGGFSGLFPDSSDIAYHFATLVSLPNVVLWCDVQLTKDGAGICFPRLTFDIGSDAAIILGGERNTYPVNGVSTSGYFTVDFNLEELVNVSLAQGVLSRSQRFDQALLPIVTVQGVAGTKPPGFWLNVQHDAFFSQHNLSMRSFVISTSRSVILDYISSPEVNFLRSIMTRFRSGTTKLVFQFLNVDDVEPSTNVKYGSLLNNLTFIKTFASGILVPKSYIWPMNKDLYLLPHTNVVSDAHKAGLEVFASEFANDVVFAYNYSYDPLAEYLSFIDNGDFTVDGVLTDFPITPSVAIDCFSHIGKNHSGSEKLLVISNEGASGDYPGCTDWAYTNAIEDGVDIIDCPVQMTKDGIPFCLGSINLMERTTVTQSAFSNRTMAAPELYLSKGIFSFSLTWSEIESLTPVIINPYSESSLFRNPKFSKGGKLVRLSDFLAFAHNATSVSGVLISIENAAYLAEKQGLSVTDAVLDVLNKTGYINQPDKKVMIQSSNSPVLIRFKKISNYELVYQVNETIRGVVDSAIEDIKKFAHSVVINKPSVFPSDNSFITGVTEVVPKLQSAGLSVFVQPFSNEFLSQAWDFFSDATVELNSFFLGAGVDGVITSFPETAVRYRRNRCLELGDKAPAYMTPVEPGSLLQFIPQQSQPPAQAPSPLLIDSDIAEPPLPPVMTSPPPSPSNGSSATPPTSPNGQSNIAACLFLSTLAAIISTLAAF